jgi:NAD+ kinase
MVSLGSHKDKQSIKVVGIFARPDRDIALSTAVSAEEFLVERGMKVQLDTEIAAYKGDRNIGIPIEEMSADLLVVVGGDGTILRASMDNPSEIPILGVKVGTGGFLTEVLPEDIVSALQRCLDGDYSIEICTKIESSLDKKVLPDALNEVLIASPEFGQMINTRVCHSQFEFDLRSDGLIASTPTGSTAYSLSAGGPILTADVDGLVLTPLCSLYNIRPIVFSFKSDLNIELRGESPSAKVVIDGLHSSPIHHGERLLIRKASRRTNFIRFEEDFFIRRAKRRLCT